MSDSLTSEKRCPTCGAELQRFTSRLHCPACNKDVTLTSNELYLALAQLRAEVDDLVTSKEAYIPYHNANRLGVALGKARTVMARNKPPACEHPIEHLFYHGFVSGNIGDFRCNLCQVIVNRKDLDPREVAARRAHETSEVEKLRTALALIYDKWEEGTPSYQDPEDYTGYLGMAFKLTQEEEARILALLPPQREPPSEKASEQYHGIGCATRRGGKCNCAAEEVPARDEGETPEEYRRRLALFGVHVPEKASAEERLAERWPDA